MNVVLLSKVIENAINLKTTTTTTTHMNIKVTPRDSLCVS